jgi:hypothetical protein
MMHSLTSMVPLDAISALSILSASFSSLFLTDCLQTLILLQLQFLYII